MDTSTVIFSAAVAAGFGVLGSIVTGYLQGWFGSRDRLRAAVRPVYENLAAALAYHRQQASTRQHPGATRDAMAAELQALLDDPAVPWPSRERRRAEEMTAEYAHTGDDDAQAAADAAEALRHHLAALLR